jgi:hypothetical protein
MKNVKLTNFQKISKKWNFCGVYADRNNSVKNQKRCFMKNQGAQGDRWERALQNAKSSGT